jgi:hypothetical protein
MCVQAALKKTTWLVGWLIFCRVFELPSPRNALKRDKQIAEKSVLIFSPDFFAKTFRADFCETLCFIAFELPSLRNTRKRDKTKKSEEALTSPGFDMDFL